LRDNVAMQSPSSPSAAVPASDSPDRTGQANHPKPSKPPDPALLRLPVGILLAAGLGSRFDPSGVRLKLLAALPGGPERGLPMAFVAARRLRHAVPRVVAVIRPGSDELADWLKQAGCELVIAPEAARGMGASMAAAIRATPSATGWLVALADMPSIAPATSSGIANALADSARRDAIIAPEFEGRRGHPVAFGADLAARLSALDGDTGARDLIKRGPVTLLPTLDAGVLRDIDTPADLAGL
jgi:molybdenum cofactor cytidylyltransferase